LREFIDPALTQEQVDSYYQKNTTGVQKAISYVSNKLPELNITTKITIPQVKSGLSHLEFIQNMSVSPNGKLIASIDYFKIIKIWDVTGKHIKSYQILNNKAHNHVNFTSDSTLFITPNTILNLNSGESVSFGSFENYMGIPLADNIYFYFDYNESSELEKLYNIKTKETRDFDLEGMYSIDVSTSINKLALLGIDGLIRIKNLHGDLLSTFGKDRTEQIKFRGKQIDSNSKIQKISLSPNGDYLISGDETGKVIIWKSEI